ncbi:esterase family protein [Planotetraspora sp. A-T 1434]|uniref:alpha/beta hydrolase n=1 Tax=Planotetraspora sp. A-T 1434 TaxID=2979219 RepID=UPI0021BE7DF9|nr:alpha/beta hydrolase family protein [Planotetraspora sp. A-T 1434]MCT9933367.1 esterase family protein [Planotetraspora sp. A-T 1434]
MRRFVAITAVLGSVLVIALSACGETPAGHVVTTPSATPDTRTGARLADVEAVNERVDRLSIQSPALGREGSVWVLKPPGWREGSTGWPVLYLLHGCCVSRGDAWLVYGDAERITAGLRAVVVVPEGGAMSWYSDWLNGPAWETFHMTEVRRIVESRYGVGGRRAIAGLSMGGLGALAYAARHPGVFQAAASFSGVIDTGYDPGGLEGLMRSYGVDPGDVWGRAADRPDVWRAHNPADLVKRLKGVRVYLSCGNGEPGPFDTPGGPADTGERAILERNRRFAAAARAAGVPVTTDFYGPGTHDWPYWSRELAKALPTLVPA